MLSNAVMTKITGPGALADNGDATVGTDLWVGRAPGYLKRSRRSMVSGGQQVLVKLDTFTLLDRGGANVAVAAGASWEACTVVIEDRRMGTPVSRRFRVQAAEHRAAGTMVDSVRLELVAEAP